MKDKFKYITKITPAFDKHSVNPRKDYGIHGCDLHMILQGEKGAVQFVLYTNWYLPSSEQKPMYPDPADLGYHSPTPRYPNQEKHEDCPYTELPGVCYCDSSCLNAKKIYQILLSEGSEGVWKALTQYYQELFNQSLPSLKGKP
jgi:hypothetical protein